MPRLWTILGWIGVVIIALITVAFAVLPGAIENSQNVTLEHEPYAVSDEAAAIHDSLRLADLHADPLLWDRNILKRSNRGHVDVPRLQESNTALQVFSAVTKSPSGLNYEENDPDSDTITTLSMVQLWPMRTWGSLLERALYQSEKLHRFEQRSDGALKIVRNKADLEFALTTGAIASILATEGAHPLEGDLDNLDALWDAGYRMVGLQHFFDNELGGSLHGRSQSGLTEFGRAVVAELESREIMIDVAHSSEAVVRDVLDMTSRPLIVSHTGMKGACDTPRNISDALMIEIAERGGLIGIGYWDAAVCDISPRGVAESIRYAVDLLGIDHVAYGADYDGAVTVIFDSSERIALTDALLDEGFKAQQIRQIAGGNAIRFMRENLPE